MDLSNTPGGLENPGIDGSRPATLTGSVEVDFDLFVNKLVAEIEGFVQALRAVEAEDVGPEQGAGV